MDLIFFTIPNPWLLIRFQAYHAKNLMLTETNFPQEGLDVIIFGVETQNDLAGIAP